MDELEKTKEEEVSRDLDKRLDHAKERAQRVLRDFEKAKRKAGDRYTEHLENMAFMEGQQYQLSKYKISRPWVVRMRTPHAKIAIDTRVSSLIANDYRGQLLPMSKEHEKAVEILNDFKNDEWERLELNSKVKKAVKASAVVREAYIHLVWDNDEKQIDAYMIDMPSSVYIDPTALEFRKARYICLLSRLSLDEAEELYPEFSQFFASTTGSMTSQERGEVSLAQDYETEQQDVVTCIVEYKRSGKMITKYTVINGILVDEEELNGLRHFPIAQMRWTTAFGSPYGWSLMDDLIDSQKAVNAIESATVNTAVAYSAPSYAISKGRGINPKDLAVTIGAPGAILQVDGDPRTAIQPLNLPTLDQSILGVKQDYIATIDRVAGITNPFMGSIGTAGNTAGGAKMTLERARIVENDVMENIQVFVEDLTHILIDYLVAHYSGQNVTSRKIDRSRGKVSFFSRKIPKLDNVEYSFFVNLNAKTSFSKEREKEVKLELYQMQNQYKERIKLLNQLDILEAYDLPDKEQLVDRYKLLSLRSDESISQVITELVQNAASLGIDMEIVQKAIVELMSGSEDTPVYDQLAAQMKQTAQEQAQLRQETMSQFKQEVTQAGVPEQAIASAEQAMMGQ